jgi:hypothetical protein
MKKDFFRATADFQGTIAGNLYWNAGADSLIMLPIL